ncbi:cryptochrome-1-like [Pecten maximus]|uniref:cryptochrome-1-like n=1 Tax=Pecten maximus TaxID=6579 RepID=UPI001458E0D9|nr:cryptochrome-1-like [Pecten maximus]
MEEEPQKQKIVAIHWFRNGLRIHDNPALCDALENCDEFYPIFIFDGEVAGTKFSGFNRMRFMHESLEDLDNTFKKNGGRLYTFQGKARDVLEGLLHEWNVTRLTYEAEVEPIWETRDKEVEELCQEHGIQLISRISHTLWNPSEVIEKNGGSPPVTYSHFELTTALLGPPERPVPVPNLTKVNKPVPDNFDQKFALPSVKDLGYEPECKEQMERINEWKGGETKALQLLEERLKNERKPMTDKIMLPNQFLPDLVGPPTSMSPHLRFGCVSVRTFYWGIHDLYQEIHADKEVPVSLTGQLVWREYFYTMSVSNIHYDKMKENPICLDIAWDEDAEKLEKWVMGKTGFPWIDAGMNQLRAEGWCHHVVRHAVSCFLTRGDLWINWVQGCQVFFKYQLDADWSVCAGNWMWMSSSAFEKVFQCSTCFCPVGYGRRMDPKGEYVRRYVPVLKDMPIQYLFEPWKAPYFIQEKANCIIGKDYPRPMLDHKQASMYCRSKMMEVHRRLASSSPIPHCAPSNSKEANFFSWLPESEVLSLCNHTQHLWPENKSVGIRS